MEMMGHTWNIGLSEQIICPDDLEYNSFLETFGEEGNLIVLGIKDTSLFTVKNLNAWNKLSTSFKSNVEVETVVSIYDLQKLIKNNQKKNGILRLVIRSYFSSKVCLHLLSSPKQQSRPK